MKKLTSFILALVASMCSLTAWAERVAPAMPRPCVPDSGQTYIMYNLEANKALNSYNSVGYNPRPIKVHITDGVVRFQLTTGTYQWYYLQGYDSSGNMTYDSSWTRSYVTWRITENEDKSYLIQNTRTSGNEYFGVTLNDNSTVYWNRGGDYQVHWFFFEEGEGIRYMAELNLYKALEQNDTTSLQYASRGWDFSYFEEMYTNRANYSSEELNTAANGLRNGLSLSARYVAPWWNETPIFLFSAQTGFWGTGSRSISFRPSYTSNNSTHSISATITVNQPSVLFYGIMDNSGQVYTEIILDGEQSKKIYNGNLYSMKSLSLSQVRMYEELSVGTHVITWNLITTEEYTGSGSSYYDFIGDIGVISSKDLVTANLLRPGSLGTEVLYADGVDDLKNVRRLKVKGQMNSDDWKKLKMMSRLQELDLSEAEITEVPNSAFYLGSSPDTTLQFLHKVVLPEGLKRIGSNSFQGFIGDSLCLPSTLESIGGRCFYKSHICELRLPDNLLTFDSYTISSTTYRDWFNYMYMLKKVTLPKNLKTIPAKMFYGLYYLNQAVMPDSLETVGEYAFYDTNLYSLTLPEGTSNIKEYAFWRNNYLKNVNMAESLKTIGDYAFRYVPANMGHLPSSLKSIGTYAFANCTGIDSLFVPNSVTNMSTSAFEGCTGIKYAELGTGLYKLTSSSLSCSNLKTLKLSSPSVVKASSGTLYSIKGVDTLYVPHYLWASYKLDEYWYNAQHIVPFDYGNMDYIPIQSRVELGHERFGGCPSINMFASPSSLSIYGDMAQEFKDVHCNLNWVSGNYGMILNECNNISVKGRNWVTCYMGSKQWYFLSMPFDVEISKVTCDDGMQYAIRYYDGAGRATNGKSGNWKNYAQTDTIPAGTGFIVQSNIAGWIYFPAAETDKKYNTFTTKEVVTPLALNPSETKSNSGWNLVGNPYQCYYNNHCLNFTAPITVWNGSTYVAYSLTDDDYAIRPNQAFFVQCPSEEYSTIGFPTQGRQVTDEIVSQNAVKELAPQQGNRRLVDLTLSCGDVTDKTRIVFNSEAKEQYETTCDAGKLMSMDRGVPQIYTQDSEGNRYAINERPDGIVPLGFYAPQNGTYTFSTGRNTIGELYLTDLVEQKTVNMNEEDYSFSATAGTDEIRFILSRDINTPDKISFIPDDKKQSKEFVGYDLSGRRTDGKQKGVVITKGKKIFIR